MRLKLINQEGNLQYILYNIQFYGKPTKNKERYKVISGSGLFGE